MGAVRFKSRQRQEIFLFSRASGLSLGAHPASFSLDTGGYFPPVKLPAPEVDTDLYLQSRLRMNGAMGIGLALTGTSFCYLFRFSLL